jgi:hypothetical protein
MVNTFPFVHTFFHVNENHPKPSDVQLLSIRHVTKVHLLQKFLDPQKHALIDNILPTCGNLSRLILPKSIPLKIATSRLDYQLFASFR